MARSFIEGLPCAGKSTLVKRLEEGGEKVIHELGRVIHPSEFPGNGKTRSEILNIDDWFIDKEKERLKNNLSGYFDRSYLTHIAYAYAYDRMTKAGAFKYTISKYEKAIQINALPLPDRIIYIDELAEESIKRQLRRIALGHRALDNFWMDKKFLQDTRFAYEKILESTSDITIQILNSSESVEQQYSQIADGHTETFTSPEINLQNYIKLTRS